MDKTFSKGLLISIGLVVALLVVDAGLSYHNTRQLTESAALVAHSHEVLDALEEVISTAKDAETGQRGFIITGEARYLEPYDTAVASIHQKVQRAKTLTANNPRQQAHFPVVEKTIAAKLAELVRTIALRKQDFEAARREVMTDKGKTAMDALRIQIDEMKQEEHRLLREREQESARSYYIAITTGLLTAVLGLGMVGAFVVLLRRHLLARNKAAATLHEQREWLRITLASIGDAVIATDRAEAVTFLNPVAQALTGWSTEEAAGQPLRKVFEIINEDTRKPAEHPVARVLREGIVIGLANHTVLIARDGSERPIEDSAAPIQDRGGHVQGVVLVFRDATAKRDFERLQRNLQAELERQVQERTAELCASEEHFRLLVEGTTDYALFLLDPEGRVVSWNSGAARIKGYQAEEIIGQHFSRFYPREDLASGKPMRELQIATAEGRYEEEGWRVRKDGSRFWANVLITALHDEAGQLRGFSKVTRDATQRKQAEEDARRLVAEQAARQAAEASAELIAAQREQLRITLESIGDGVIATDARRNVVLLNPVARALTGWKHEEAIGRPLDEIFDIKNEQTGQRAQNPVDRVLREGVVIGLANHTVVVSRDGTERPIEDSAAPIKGSRGDVQGCVLVFHDVTEKRQAQRALRESEAHLQEANRRKDEFLAMLAHELRNPLAPIRNALQILRMPHADGPMAVRAREMMERQVQHLVRLVDDLLDVSRIMRNKIDLRKERVDLRQVVDRAGETVQPVIDARGHELGLVLPSGPVWVEADPVRLAQVVANLLNNAAKFTEQASRIELTLEQDGPTAVLRVRDNGIGLAPELLPHVFDLFVQGDRTIARTQGGLGIGLTLVKRLVEMHGGSIAAASGGLGRGSEFIVRLPTAHAADDEQVTDGADRATSSHPRRVLVVDDNVDAAESLAMLLRLMRHQVHTVHDGPAALEATKQYRPDVVLLDIGLPGMDGYAVAQRLRQMPEGAAMRLVAVTGYGQEEDRRRALEAGFDHHLTKPVDQAALEAILSS